MEHAHLSTLEVIVINLTSAGIILVVEEIVSSLFLLHILLRPSLIDPGEGYKEVKRTCHVNQVGMILKYTIIVVHTTMKMILIGN